MVITTDKVVCYVINAGRLLVFTHDDVSLTVTGVQVPAGSVKAGEPIDAAARRELFEETGLHARTVRFPGSQAYDLRPTRQEIALRHFFAIDVMTLPNKASWSAGEHDPSNGNKPVAWTCWWLPLEQAHVLAAGLGAFIGKAVAEAQFPEE